MIPLVHRLHNIKHGTTKYKKHIHKLVIIGLDWIGHQYRGAAIVRYWPAGPSRPPCWWWRTPARRCRRGPAGWPGWRWHQRRRRIGRGAQWRAPAVGGCDLASHELGVKRNQQTNHQHSSTLTLLHSALQNTTLSPAVPNSSEAMQYYSSYLTSIRSQARPPA